MSHHLHHRGRRDSNSSQESEPGRSKKRPLSPPSDDGHNANENGATFPVDDDTPPPESAPLLRQPISTGFSALVNTNGIATYQAEIAPSTAPTHFLPGQSISDAPTQPPPPPPKPKRKTRRKKSVIEPAAVAGFGRFRLEAYNPEGPVAILGAGPQAQPGPGPYSSLYRAGPYKRNKPTPSPTLTSGISDDASRSSVHSGNALIQQPIPLPLQRPPPESFPPQSTVQDSFRQQQERSGPSSVSSYHPSSYQTSLPDNNSDRPQSEIEDQPRRTAKQPLRMVTLLIQDIRSGRTDHQLAEVKVTLRPTDDPADGFWADAKDICERLQSSPSRIDGPARVFTLRGKYRQFILRVDKDNRDETVSSNVVVSPDRTLMVVVELLQQSGTYAPPRYPLQSRSPTPDDVDSFGKQGMKDVERRRNAELSILRAGSLSAAATDSPTPSILTDSITSRKRPHSPPLPAIENMISSPPKIQRTSAKMHSREFASPPLDLPDREWEEYDSPDSDEDPESLHELIVKRVDQLLQLHPDWTEYFQWKARPQTCNNVLSQYKFIQGLIKKYVGQPAPFRTSSHLIEASHVLAAMNIEDSKFAADSEETLRLLDLYGPDGSRHHDPRVMDLLGDNTVPTANAKPIKRLLRLLREVDQSWGQRGSGVPGDQAP